MATSETEIINAALRLVAGKRITSTSQGVKNANVANDLYKVTRDDMLASHPWNFATRRSQLARSSTAPAFEFDYAYVLPSDWLRTISMHDNDSGGGTVIGREEEVGGQGVICASVESLYLRYVGTLTDVNRMPADFRKALVYSLARDLSIPVADSNTIRDFYEKKADRQMLRAKSSDAQGSYPETRPRGSWANSRSGWRSSPFDGR